VGPNSHRFAIARSFIFVPEQLVSAAVHEVDLTAGSTNVAAKAFDPFYTTKGVGKGTGLGLSQVYGFVRQSGGSVKIYSEVGVGTSLKIYLPRYVGNPVQAGSVETATWTEAGDTREVVMVVEDDDRVRSMSVAALKELGYTVIEASRPREAIQMFEVGQQVDLLFTDVVMPEMSGRQLVDRLLTLKPDLKVLFTTGYTRNAIVHNGVLDTGTQLLSKPFSIDDLAAKVRSIFDT
jgi:CheY-like chemotaxis protein